MCHVSHTPVSAGDGGPDGTLNAAVSFAVSFSRLVHPSLARHLVPPSACDRSSHTGAAASPRAPASSVHALVPRLCLKCKVKLPDRQTNKNFEQKKVAACVTSQRSRNKGAGEQKGKVYAKIPANQTSGRENCTE